MPTQEEMTAIVDLYLARLSQGDLDGVLALYSDNATLEDPVGSEIRRGRASLREFYRTILAGDVNAERTGTVRCAANEAAFPFRATSQASECPVTVEIIYHLCFDNDGRVISMRAFWGSNNITKQ